jgi:hypothetical protein
MTMADPKTVEEYNTKFRENTRYSGIGLDTVIHTPCPFCAEPDFMSYKFMEVKEATKKGATCKSCGRTSKAVYTAETHDHISFEMVITGGDDPPPYMKMRRVKEE